MQFDLRAVPFSTFGTYMSLNHIGTPGKDEALCLRSMYGTSSSREVFNIEVTREGTPVPFREMASPTLLRLEAEEGLVHITFAGANVLRIRGQGVGIRLRSRPENRPYAFPGGDGRWQVKSSPSNTNYMLIPLRGSLDVDAPWRPHRHQRGRRFYCPGFSADFTPDETHRFEASIQEFRSAWQPASLDESFEEAHHRVEDSWVTWLKQCPAAPHTYMAARELAGYINWSAVVSPGEHITRPTMLMSKNWMTQCWSWDHCFNAMSTAYVDPRLGWHQFMTLFDHQDEWGALPDSVSAERNTWNFCKPPIHGWALNRLLAHADLQTPTVYKEIYRPLARWTEWWMKYRDYDGDGIPQYHHGNDSGWDNATVFDGGFPVEAPDLSAFLVLQMDALAALAARLGKTRPATQWKKRADELLARLIAHSWNGEQFVSPRDGTHEVFPEGDSLLNFIPIVLGKRLPKPIRDKVAAALRPGRRFVTPYGPATESPRSSLYEEDGYWRGPIWAPSTMHVIDGLERGGYRSLARTIARSFCDMCANHGFAENFDPLTGKALCDPAYTWTSSVFLLLAHEMLRR